MPELTDDALTADFRVLQRRRGHRFSVDDVTTAWVAASSAPNALTAVDLGCGIGSVLLMLAWKLPKSRFTGIEAQEVSFGLAEKNVERNSAGDRIELRHGDFRDLSVTKGIDQADLVSCTPPYVPVGQGTPSPDSQRAHARQEMRGGVEDYLRTARPILKSDGIVVTCADARYPERVTTTATELGLHICDYRPVVPRAGRDPLFTVWTLSPSQQPAGPTGLPIVIRDKDGVRTKLAREIREFFGLPSERLLSERLPSEKSENVSS